MGLACQSRPGWGVASPLRPSCDLEQCLAHGMCSFLKESRQVSLERLAGASVGRGEGRQTGFGAGKKHGQICAPQRSAC